MFAVYDKRNINLIILKILWEHTDAEHRLQQQEIVQLVKMEYGLDIDRRTVKNNVESLKDLLFDTDLEIDTGKGYCLLGRDFTDVELRTLIDSVLFSKQLSKKQAQDLIGKLKRLSSKHFCENVSSVSAMEEFCYTDGKQQVMFNLDLINEAINLGKKISFTYDVYGTDLQPKFKRNGYIYVVSPYQIILHNEHYYLLCNFEKYSDIAHLRIDKMTQLQVLEEKVKDKEQIPELGEAFNLSKYLAEHLYLYGGETVHATVKCRQSLIDELVDRFGKNFRIVNQENGEITIRVKGNEQSLFYWALQYGVFAEVLEPQSLRNRIREAIGEMGKKYGEEL